MAHTRTQLALPAESSIDEAFRRERDGDLRTAMGILQPLLAEDECGQLAPIAAIRALLVASDCTFRMCDYTASVRHIERIELLAGTVDDRRALALAGIHRARICYQQGRYSQGLDYAERAAQMALERGDFVVAARARMCQDYIAMGQADYPAAERYIRESVAYAKQGGDEFIESWVLNSAGQHYYYLALAKVLPQHARGHPSSAEPQDFIIAQEEILTSVDYFTRAISLARSCGALHHAGIVESNYVRVCIMLGDADKTLTPLRRALRECQDSGLKNNELSLRHTYAWALRACGHFAEAARQIEAALVLARRLGRVNRVVELLHYDRSLVLAGMGDHAGALASYRRYQRPYLRTAPVTIPGAGQADAQVQPAVARPPLEPFYMKRADNFLKSHANEAFELLHLAEHCGVSARSLQLGFRKFRGITPMAYARNLRLDAVHRELQAGNGTVAALARQFSFKSVTTFSMEYRRRFGVAPRVTVAEGRRRNGSDM
ncbi:MAG: helix-turn-helix transcriptional regulator [Burkholderiales bacterium]|nr:helix-turn-helix transcriptional regulator [Burkholderiales bacterium]